MCFEQNRKNSFQTESDLFFKKPNRNKNLFRASLVKSTQTDSNYF